MAEPSVQNQNQPRRAARSSHGRRRPHGRGGRGGAKSAPVSTHTVSCSSAPPNSLTSAAGEKNDQDDPAVQTQTDSQQDDSQEQDLCWICAEPIKYYAVSECNHRTCHVCALRLRALYKKLDCTFCKVRLASTVHCNTFQLTNVRNDNQQLSSPFPLMPPSRLMLQKAHRSKMKSWRYRLRRRK